MLKTDDPIQLGAHEYRITKPLGAGRVAQVYQAERLPERSVVVVKLLKDDRLHDQGAYDEFEKEARLLREVLPRAEEAHKTRYAVSLYDSGRDQMGRPFQVQELALGQPAVFFLPLKEDTALEIAIQLARMLHVVHSVDVAVPDMKLEEIFWDSVQIRAVDWNLTRSGLEEVRRDQFRCGALLYHLFAGQPLLADTVNCQFLGEPGFGVPGWQELSYGVRAIVGKAIHRDVARRYAAAQDLLDDLSWFREICHLATERKVEEIRDQARSMRKRRPELAIAACEQGLRSVADAGLREDLERLRQEAEQELENEVLRSVATARANLNALYFQDAIGGFESALKSDPANRAARYYLAQARVGLAMDTRKILDTENGKDAWKAVTQLTSCLMHSQDDLAAQWLANARSLVQDGEGVGKEFDMLDGMIRASRLVGDAERALSNHDFAGALEKLASAQVVAPDDLWIARLRDQVDQGRKRTEKVEELWAQVLALTKES